MAREPGLRTPQSVAEGRAIIAPKRIKLDHVIGLSIEAAQTVTGLRERLTANPNDGYAEYWLLFLRDYNDRLKDMAQTVDRAAASSKWVSDHIIPTMKATATPDFFLEPNQVFGFNHLRSTYRRNTYSDDMFLLVDALTNLQERAKSRTSRTVLEEGQPAGL